MQFTLHYENGKTRKPSYKKWLDSEVLVRFLLKEDNEIWIGIKKKFIRVWIHGSPRIK